MEKTKISAIEKMFAEKEARKRKNSKNVSMSDVAKKKKSVKTAKAEILDGSTETESSSPTEKSNKKIATKKNINTVENPRVFTSPVVFIIALVVMMIIAYAIVQSDNIVIAPDAGMEAGELAQTESDSVATIVGKFFELPIDETPVITTVTEIERNGDQKVFARAQDGDKILTYANNDRIIIFRPSTNKIIEIAQLTGMSNCSTAQAASEAISLTDSSIQKELQIENKATVKTAVYNGSQITGLARKIGERISAVDGVNVSEKTNAIGDYKKTLIIDLSGSHTELAQTIANLLGGEVGELPVGEKKPQADILIIGGSELEL